MSGKGDQRRVPGNMPLTYDRQQPFTDHTSPGPSAPFPFYDRFVPEEPPVPQPVFRDEYNPNAWGLGREFLPRTQLPERFRPAQANGWSRPATAAWVPPEPVAWPDRREPVREAYTPQWNNRPPRDTGPTRMFEPSDNWKQTHSERGRTRPHFSPSQPVIERYRPYSPPPPNSPVRNRFPYTTPRSESYRPPQLNESKDLVPEDSDLYGSGGRDHGLSPLSTTPDRADRRARGEERSVSPISVRNTQHSSSPGFASGPPPTKRESPELPHLEALPRKPGPAVTPSPVHVPPSSLPAKPSSRSPSYSSTASSVHVQHMLPLLQPKAGLPPKPPFQFQSRPPMPSSVPLPARIQTKSPQLQITSVGRVSPEAGDSLASTPQDEFSRTSPVATSPQPPIIQQKQTEGRPPVYESARNNGRRSFNAPAFVPSTLAIDAPLMFPTSGSSKDDQPGEQPAKGLRDDGESDMDLSLPASPVKGILEEAEAESLSISGSITQSVQPISSQPVQAQAKVITNDEDAADASDMDMSPPPSPVLKPASSPAVDRPSDESRGEKAQPPRPSLAIDTRLSSPQLPHTLLRQSSSASPVPTTPENAIDDTAGDESDMDMSSPTSETAPSPPPAGRKSPSPVPAITILEKSAPAIVSKPSSVPEPALTAEPPTHAEATPSPRAASVLLHILAPHTPTTEESVPGLQLSAPSAVEVREVSVQASPRSSGIGTLERLPVEAGELSPPVSEETLREETEGIEKDHEAGAGVVLQKVVPAQEQEAAALAEGAEEGKVTGEIPLSDALRMVAKLRFRHDAHTQEARVEPILFSNRTLTTNRGSPEAPPAPPPNTLAQTVTEKEQYQALDGIYDGTKHSLRKRFAQHRAALADKVNRLREEYISLHERWMRHCAKLDEVARANALEEAAATAGRTTRRTAAMGDAVRSDLEMEQILASLGNEELTDANHLSAKNAATIPDMVSVTKGRVEYIYDDTNNLVEDPHEFYKLETGIDDWTDDEKAILVEKYAVHPKQFGIIADFIPNKTAAQCVTFYYLHKNTTIDFRKVVAKYNNLGKRRRSGRGRKQKGNALLADILKHDDEVSRGVTPNTSGRRKRGAPSTSTSTSTPVPSTSAEPVEQTKKDGTSLSRRGTAQNTPTSTPTPDPESGVKRPRRRANPSAKAVAAMEQEPTDDPVDEDVRPAKRVRKGRKSRADAESGSTPVLDEMPPAPAALDTRFIDLSDLGARKKASANGVTWSDEDKALFLKLLAQHGDDFKRIAASMPNKTTIQVAAFYKANLAEMELAKVAALAPKRSPTPQENGFSLPGSGVVTPSTKASTPAPENAPGLSAMSRTRSNGHMSPPLHPDSAQLQLPGTDKRTTTASREPVTSARTSQTARPVVDTPRAPYQGGIGSAFASTSRSNPTPLTSGLGPRPPPTLQMTFPSALAYSNLSPSSFTGTGDRHHQSSLSRATAPVPPLSASPSGGLGGPSMMFEFTDFAPQSWQLPGSLAHQSQAVPGATTSSNSAAAAAATGVGAGQVPPPGLPAALETTDDLVRYLEHRTRLTAGQNNDSDFM